MSTDPEAQDRPATDDEADQSEAAESTEPGADRADRADETGWHVP